MAQKTIFFRRRRQNEKTAMVVILPDERQDVREVESRLKTVELTSVLERLSDATMTEHVDVTMPKFETAFTVEDMEGILRQMGVNTIFDEKAANFSMISDENIHVSKIAHKAIVKVNEEGSEAAAVTSAIFETRYCCYKTFCASLTVCSWLVFTSRPNASG